MTGRAEPLTLELLQLFARWIVRHPLVLGNFSKKEIEHGMSSRDLEVVYYHMMATPEFAAERPIDLLNIAPLEWYNGLGARRVIDDAVRGEAAAHKALSKVLDSFGHDNSPVPRELTDYFLGPGRNAPKRRGRPAGRTGARDIALALAVTVLLRVGERLGGLTRYRDPGWRDDEPTAHACALIAWALKEEFDVSTPKESRIDDIVRKFDQEGECAHWGDWINIVLKQASDFALSVRQQVKRERAKRCAENTRKNSTE